MPQGSIPPSHFMQFLQRAYLGIAIALALGTCFLKAQTPVTATDGGTQSPSASWNVDQIKSELSQLETNQDLDETLKKNLTDQFKLAQERFAQAATFKSEADQFRNLISSGPDEIKSLKTQLEALPAISGSNAQTNHLADISPSASSKDLEQILTTEKARLADLKNELNKVDAEIQTQSTRPEKNRVEMEEARKKLAETTSALTAAPPEQETPLEAKARLAVLEARRQARSNEITRLEQESLSHDTRLNLRRAIKDLNQRRVALLDAKVKALEERVNQRRQEEAAEAKREADRIKREAINKHEVIKFIAETNSKLTTEISQVAERLGELTPEQEVLTQKLTSIGGVFTDISKKIEVLGIDRTLVDLLLVQRRRLPTINALEKTNSVLESTIREYRLKDFQTDEDLDSLSTPEALLTAGDTDIQNSDQYSDLLMETEKLLTQQRGYLNQLSENYGSLIDRLGKYHSDYESYILSVKNYRDFLDAKLMWVPTSTSVLGWIKAPWMDAAKWLFRPDHWKEAGSAIKEVTQEAPFQSAMVLLFSGSMLVLRRRIRKKAETWSLLTRRISTDSFWHTSLFMVTVLLQSLIISLPVAFVGMALTQTALELEFSQALGASLLFVSCNLFALLFLMELCRPKGIAEVHFRWKEATIKLIRRHMVWFVSLASLTGWITVMMEYQAEPSYKDSMGRLAFIVSMGATTLFLRSVLHPNTGMFAKVIEDNPKSWLARTSGFWIKLTLAIPLSLILLAILGYYYAAVHLGMRLLASFGLVIFTMVLHDWGLRYFYVQERKIALEQALEKRRTAQQESPVSQDEMALPAVEDPDVDLSAVKEQPRRLLGTLVGCLILASFWMVWSGVVPALNFLNTFVVWDSEVVVDGTKTIHTTTLLNLIQFLIVSLLTIAAARNIPGVLEIAILQNLPLQSGNRYAITTICQYLIVSIGVLWALSFFGIEWSQFGWILAALSVGLGFGLQEIVANFVCGILLFIERPIRVGDIVTVSDVSGMVTRIQIRATTIMNWDRQEFIVPNKEFITGRILNWTLTNTVNRITITVGVAYGCDTEKAKNLLLEIANNHPEVMDDPAPFAAFDQFGDSSLNIVLRCYLPNLDKRLATIHEIHTQIHERFNMEGIEIPFPQRDLHIRSVISGMNGLNVEPPKA
jgi:potassium efflux system protein